jgi:SNF family Na+-dependent transporter
MEITISDGIEDLGLPEWRLTLLLLLCWTLTCLGLIKGVQSLGKVSYFTSVFPYILITTLVIRGSMLEGAKDGILFYITPRWEKLREPGVWADAAIQIFYSLGPCMGTLITMSSFNKFKNNCLRNAITVALINCSTSIYGGFAIFSVVGFMAKQAGAPIEKVAQAGPGLAFVVYPEGLAMMPVAPLWSVLFFFMMLTIGMGSLLSQLETVISAIQDEWPILRVKGTLFRISMCVAGFLIGLPQVCRGGFYLLNIFDNFTGGVNLLVLGFVEIFTINYIYGYDRFAEDISMMLGKKPNLYWKTCWKGVSLIAVAGILLFLCVMYQPPTCGDYIYPEWALNFGWMLSLSSVIWLPVLFIKVRPFVQACLNKP